MRGTYKQSETGNERSAHQNLESQSQSVSTTVEAREAQLEELRWKAWLFLRTDSYKFLPQMSMLRLARAITRADRKLIGQRESES